MFHVWVAGKMCDPLANAVVASEIKLFQNYLSLCRHNFISVHENLAEIISKLFHVHIAAHKYFPTCSLSLK